MNAPTPAAESAKPRRPFDGVMITLSAALLVIFGILIGRFVVSSRTVEVVDHFDAELSTLRAELVELNRQLLQSESKTAALELTVNEYRQLAGEKQVEAARQQALDASLQNILAQQEACLGEIHQYVALNESIPAIDVLAFAEAMFAGHAQTREQLAGQAASPSDLPRLPRLAARQTSARSVIPSSEPAPKFAGRAESRSDLDGPTLSAPLRRIAAGEYAHHAEDHRTAGVYFAPPQSKRKPRSYISFSPRREDAVLRVPQTSGITFHSTAETQSDAVRR